MIDIQFKVYKHLDRWHLHSNFVLGIRTVVRFSASEIEMHFPYYLQEINFQISSISELQPTLQNYLWFWRQFKGWMTHVSPVFIFVRCFELRLRWFWESSAKSIVFFLNLVFNWIQQISLVMTFSVCTENKLI